MKKFFYSVFVASTMLMATSCSQENELVNDEPGGEATQSVTFTIETGAVESRTAGDGKSVDQLHYEVWTNDNVLVISSIDGRNPKVKYTPEDVVDGKATVKLNLVRNVEYDITFWAQVENGNPYQITNGLDNITYTDKSALKANDENYDAFFKTIDDFKVGQGSNTVILNRPFAQINVGTTDYDYKNAQALGVDIQKSEVTITKVHDTFNARTSEASGEFDVKFNLNDILDETFQLKDADFKDYLPQDYQFLGMNYVFADPGHESLDELHTLTIKLNTDETTTINTLKVNNMPMQRNWRTNIVGNLLTGDEEFQIIVDPEFKGEYNTHIWDGQSIHKPEFDAATQTWIITTAPELAWVSSALIKGEDHENRSTSQMEPGFKGQTIKLAYDIDLNGKEWTPISTSNTQSKTFQGTFDGQGHTISNMLVNGKDAAGLFGYVYCATIKNVIIDNATINSNHFAGGIVAWVNNIQGNTPSPLVIENCQVTNTTITSTPESINGAYDNGDKVGGLIGAAWFTNNDYPIANEETKIANCLVKNTTVKAYRDLGGLIGYAQGVKMEYCTVNNVTVEQDLTNGYKDETPTTVGTIIGRYEGSNFVDGTSYVTNAAGIAEALTSDKENINVVLAQDIEVPITSLGQQTGGSGEYKLGSESTKSITLDLNGKKLTITTTYWSAIGAKNPGVLFTIKNGTMNSTGNSATTWNAYDLRFSNCNYVFENVVFEKAIALDNVGKTTTLKNVTINESHDYYAMWITAEGQTVTVDGLTINSSGRGIKIDEQYVCQPNDNALEDRTHACEKVTLNINNAKFTTVKKAAVLIKSAEGAAINWGEGNDISNVTADKDFAVWVDEDAAAYANKVTVNGALCKVESSGDAVVESPADFEEAIKNVKNEAATLYIPEGTYIIPDAAQGKTLTIVGTGDPANTKIATQDDGSYEGCDYSLDGSTVVFENITINTNSATYTGYARCNGTYKNCIINGTYTLYGNSTFENCTFNVSGDVYNIWTWGAPEATFIDCTFNCDGKAMLLYGQANTKLTMNNCTFNDNGGLEDKKAAIEIGNDYNKSYTLIVNNAKVNGFEINDKGINTNTTLWANKNSMSKDELNVVVDGVDVY